MGIRNYVMTTKKHHPSEGTHVPGPMTSSPKTQWNQTSIPLLWHASHLYITPLTIVVQPSQSPPTQTCCIIKHSEAHHVYPALTVPLFIYGHDCKGRDTPSHFWQIVVVRPAFTPPSLTVFFYIVWPDTSLGCVSQFLVSLKTPSPVLKVCILQEGRVSGVILTQWLKLHVAVFGISTTSSLSPSFLAHGILTVHVYTSMNCTLYWREVFLDGREVCLWIITVWFCVLQ